MKGFYVTAAGPLSIAEFRRAMKGAAEDAQRMCDILVKVREHIAASKAKVSNQMLRRLQDKLALENPELMVAHLGFGTNGQDTGKNYLFIRAYHAPDYSMEVQVVWGEAFDLAIASFQAQKASCLQAAENAASIINQYNSAASKLIGVVMNFAVIPAPADVPSDSLGTPVEPIFSYLGGHELN